MKIQIKDSKDYYETETPEYIKQEDLPELIERLKEIYRMLENNLVKTNIPKTQRVPKYHVFNRSNKRPWCDSKQKSIHIMKLHYKGSFEDKEKFVKETNKKYELDIDWQKDVVKSIDGLRRRWGITPEEIGLDIWPVRGWWSSRIREAKERNRLNLN